LLAGAACWAEGPTFAPFDARSDSQGLRSGTPTGRTWQRLGLRNSDYPLVREAENTPRLQQGDSDAVACSGGPAGRRTSSVPASPQARRYVAKAHAKAQLFMATYDVDPQDRLFRNSASLLGRTGGNATIPAAPAEQQPQPPQQAVVAVAKRRVQRKRKDDPCSGAPGSMPVVRPREQRHWRYPAAGRCRANPRVSRRQEQLDAKLDCNGFWNPPHPSGGAQQPAVQPEQWCCSPGSLRPQSAQGHASLPVTPSRPRTPCAEATGLMLFGSMSKPAQKHVASKSGPARPAASSQ
jgi:hypothetical protein